MALAGCELLISHNLADIPISRGNPVSDSARHGKRASPQVSKTITKRNEPSQSSNNNRTPSNTGQHGGEQNRIRTDRIASSTEGGQTPMERFLNVKEDCWSPIRLAPF